MLFRVVSRLLCSAAVFALATPLWATPVEGTISVVDPILVDGKTVPAGDYRVMVEGNKVVFERGRKIVAEAPCSLKEMKKKDEETALLLDRNELKEIRLAGKKEAIEVR